MTLSLRNIGYAHGDTADSVVFSDFSHDFHSGEMVAVTGPSGAGKTTLLSLLSLLINPNDGEIWFGDRLLNRLDVEQVQQVRRAEIGMIFQTARVFSQLTILEHIEFARACSQTSISQEEVDALVDALGLRPRLDAIPSALSGGERTRLASLLALAKNPRLMLADEPTASLDQRNSQVLLSLLRKLADRLGTIAVLVTHDPVAVEACDRSLVLTKN